MVTRLHPGHTPSWRVHGRGRRGRWVCNPKARRARPRCETVTGTAASRPPARSRKRPLSCTTQPTQRPFWTNVADLPYAGGMGCQRGHCDWVGSWSAHLTRRVWGVGWSRGRGFHSSKAGRSRRLEDSLLSDFRFRGRVPRTWPEQVRLRGQLGFEELWRERGGRLGKKKKPRAEYKLHLVPRSQVKRRCGSNPVFRENHQRHRERRGNAICRLLFSSDAELVKSVVLMQGNLLERFT